MELVLTLLFPAGGLGLLLVPVGGLGLLPAGELMG
jgi:hypothetical protein